MTDFVIYSCLWQVTTFEPFWFKDGKPYKDGDPELLKGVYGSHANVKNKKDALRVLDLLEQAGAKTAVVLRWRTILNRRTLAEWDVDLCTPVTK